MKSAEGSKSAQGSLMGDLKAVINDAEELLRDAAEEHGDKVKEHLQDAGAELEKRVRAHPLAAVGIAAGVGLILGLLLSRK